MSEKTLSPEQCLKAKYVHGSIKQFNVSKWRFEKCLNHSDLHNILIQGKFVSADKHRTSRLKKKIVENGDIQISESLMLTKLVFIRRECQKDICQKRKNFKHQKIDSSLYLRGTQQETTN